MTDCRRRPEAKQIANRYGMYREGVTGRDKGEPGHTRLWLYNRGGKECLTGRLRATRGRFLSRIRLGVFAATVLRAAGKGASRGAPSSSADDPNIGRYSRPWRFEIDIKTQN